MNRSGLLLAVAAASIVSCGRYRDFTLPAPAGTPLTVTWQWQVNWQWRPGVLPALEPGPTGDWDSSDVLNPSVLSFHGKLLNLYSGFDGKTWHTGLATSADGIHWKKQGKVLSPDPATWEGNYIAANGSAIADTRQISYYYQAGSPFRIGLARSPDGRKWRKFGVPVLGLGPYGSWDERGVADPDVVRFGDAYYLFYTGMDRASRQRLGIAASSDGITWYKLRSNPVLDIGGYGSFDENGLGEPAVWSSHGFYWMLYAGRDRGENRRLGMARSRDGVHWEKQPPIISGDQPWDAKVICDPSVMPTGDGVRVWFGGGDVARPDERIHGRIGAAVLQFGGGLEE